MFRCFIGRKIGPLQQTLFVLMMGKVVLIQNEDSHHLVDPILMVFKSEEQLVLGVYRFWISSESFES